MDIAQAFPNVSKARLANIVYQQSGNHKLAHWVNSFMSDRTVTLRFDGETGEEHKVETGIPQGSPASPILFNLYIAPLIKTITEEIDREFEGEAITPTFIDDFTLAVAGKDWDQAITRAEILIDKAYKWAEENHLRFEEEKMEWIRIGRKGEEEEMITLPGGTEKPESREIKWLGIWIDCGLTFKNHVREKVARASRAAQSIIRLGRGSKGMGVNNARKMYIACSRQVAEYGGKVWWKGQKTLAKVIDKANIQAMKRIGEHFRTAPTAAVEVENDMIPTEHGFNDKERLLAIKALQRAPNHPTYRAVKREIENVAEAANTWRAGRRRKTTRKRGMPGAVRNLETLVGKEWNKIKNWKTLHREEKRWERETREDMEIEIRFYDKEGMERQRQEWRSEEANEVVMYSDGSKKHEGTAAAVCRLSSEGEVIRNIGFRLGRKMEIMDAEMVGIKKAIEIGMKDAAREGKSTITVRCDSQEAIKRVIKRQGTSGEMMAHKIRWLYDAAKTQKIKIRLEWVKAHANIKGNTIADEAAKAAAGTGPLDKDTFVSFAHLERESRETTVREWGKDWKTRRNAENALQEPAQRHLIRFEDTDRKDRATISRLRTGHIAINQYLHRFKKKDTAECECGGGEHSVTHILTACKATEAARAEDEDHKTVQTLLWTKTGIESALRIWKEFAKWRHGNGERDEEREEEEREATRGWGGLKEGDEGEAG